MNARRAPGLSASLAAWLLRHRKRLALALGAIAIYALLGFLLVPWLLERNLVNVAQDRLGARLAVTDIAFNPFVLSLEVTGVELDDPGGARLLDVERFFANFQTSSLFRRAWTFRELHITGPQLHLRRDGSGETNLAFLSAAQPADTMDNNEVAGAAAASSPPRLLIADFVVSGSALHWQDHVPPDPVTTSLGPINVAIADLNTLPDRVGEQEVIITTETQGTLTWSGSLALNPFLSEGHAAVKGSHFPLTSAYLKHQIGFDIVDGEADIELDYRVALRPDGLLDAAVRNFSMTISDIRVRTFNEALGREADDREVLELSRISLDGGELSWPEKTVSASSLAVDGGAVSLLRYADGGLNVARATREPGSSSDGTSDTSSETPGDGDPWQVSLSRLNVGKLAMDLEDQSVSPAANVGWQSLEVEVEEISNTPGAGFPTSLKIVGREGGVVAASGLVTVIPDAIIDLDVQIEALALATAQPYLRSKADISLDSGALSAEFKLASQPDARLNVAGDIEIADFEVTETDEGSRVGSWAGLGIDNFRYSLTEGELEISEIQLRQPYGDIVIAEDGTVNLGRIRKETPVAEEAEDAQDSNESGLTVTIGRVSIEDAAADFKDLSLPLPFSAEIRNLNGELTTIATQSAAPSSVDLQGTVDEFGQVRVTGTVTPLDLPANTDLRVEFENVDMPKMSAYTVPFAGREIASGRLDLDLGYKVSAGALEGENRVVLRDFELGDKVDHPGAMSLPLGLAVALLKDPDGRINLDVPVRGDVNDPEFKYSRVVVRALVNLVTKIVTSPFALLANLVGSEADELEFLAFEAGYTELAPPELEKTGKIAEALGLRPKLILTITGTFDETLDANEIRAARVDQRIEALMAEGADTDDTMFAARRQEAVEGLFIESGLEAEPSVILDELKSVHTSVATEEAPAVFDSLAYTEALLARLVMAETVDQAELLALGDARAARVQQAIVAANDTLVGRIIVESPSTAVRADAGIVKMQVQLTASGGDN